MAVYLKKFNNHTEYEEARQNLILPNVSYCVSENEVHYNPYVHDYSKDYLTFISSSDNNVIGWKAVQQSGNSPIRTISYSTDKINWTSVASTTAGVTLATLNSGDKLYLKGTENNYGKFYQGFSWSQFTSSGQFTAEGNIMSLIGGDNFSGLTSFTSSNESAFCKLFIGCTSLTDVSNLILPATTLAEYCYYNMFYDCTSLTTAPELPATTLAKSCYYCMFFNTSVLPDCSNIDFTSTSVVANGGLNGLFAGTKVIDNDLMNILPKNANNKYCLPVTTLTDSCYQSMFQGCTSLTTAPELPATTLATDCYQGMFQGCTALTTAPELPATTLANYCYKNMFQGCTSLTTAPELPATTLANSCYVSMFKGCTSLTTAPVLSSTTLVNACYNGMFYGCSKLNSITCLATDISATNCTNAWVIGVASSGTFTKNASMSSWTTGNNGIPSNWTVVDAS